MIYFHLFTSFLDEIVCTWEGMGRGIPKPPDGGVKILLVWAQLVKALELSTCGVVRFRFHG
jgi:hypothetical protein